MRARCSSTRCPTRSRRTGTWPRGRSIRRRKGYSAPGQPPHSHHGALREGILYAYEPVRRSIVIGPVGFRSQPYLEVTVPEVLEYGGTVRTRKRGERRVRRFEARPYIGPAFERGREKLDEIWAKAVR